ncbi:hypothetical protein [Aestuariivivens marinum]|uniref:hypothetical protein n=1 Tax=Aestuariivivens marinum TaxID=2913555 RepID=UPI001F5AB50C|nr:hypothetical protein [Aestuariivivens marinum]
MMFKKDDLEEFLFLWSKAENIPFSNYEDALVNNYSALDKPFIDYSKSVIGWHNTMKVEISENLLSLTIEDRKMYLEYVKNRIENETWIQDSKKLTDLLKTLSINTDSLNFEHNKDLNDVLNLSFKELSQTENLGKFRDLHREYYCLLLNIERNKILKYLQSLNGEQSPELSSVQKDNPYPRIFKSPKGFILFEKLKAEFGDTRENLKNYSFIFRRMVDDNLIFSNLKHQEFIEFLSTYDIHIDRINTLNDIGNIDYREHIYSSLKAT